MEKYPKQSSGNPPSQSTQGKDYRKGQLADLTKRKDITKFMTWILVFGAGLFVLGFFAFRQMNPLLGLRTSIVLYVALFLTLLVIFCFRFWRLENKNDQEDSRDLNQFRHF